MPCKNDYVNYSAQGICKIEDICPMNFGSGSSPREYYILKPIHQENAHIFVPVDNQKLVAQMRPVLSPEEIDRTILSVQDQKMPWISDRKLRLAQFQEILSRRREQELLLLVSCLYLKSRERAKGLSPIDAQILKKAESIIEQEFSFSLKISAQSIGGYIRQKLGLTEPAGALPCGE